MAGRAQARKRALQAAQGLKCIGGYTRLSEDRDGNKIGYEIQRDAIDRWAKAYDYTVVWYQDKDITAGSSDVVRPEYERMLNDLKEGVVAGIIVWRLDRLVRLTREFERCFAVVEKAGGYIVDIEQGFTTKTATGKLIMSLLTNIAEMEIVAMRARQAAHQRKKAEEGKYSGGGHRAFGFVGAERDENGKITNQGRIGVDWNVDEARLIQDAAKRIAWRAESYADIIRDWSGRKPPVLGTNGNVFSVGSLVDILTSPRVAGLRTVETFDEKTGKVIVHEYKAVWDPILDPATWKRLREQRKLRPDGNGPAATYLLGGGLGVCGRCGTKLVGAPRPLYKSKEKLPSYRCDPSAPAKRNGSCGGTSIWGKQTEDVVLAQLFGRLEDSPALLDMVTREDTDAAANALSEAIGEVEDCNDELARLATQRHLPRGHEDRLEEVEWRAARSQVLQRLEAATRAKDKLSRAASYPQPPKRERGSRNSLHRWFLRLTVSQQQAFLRAYVRRVSVLPARPGLRTFDPGRIVVEFPNA